ncbi:Inorganic pyrophosphatase [Puccinia graminis f. sp. tritici]|uniref:inorganic diphosphatase n=1 Tax=Puccinia graminis f. sp. tritici TaxID=56615 RepID=A0A5B0SK25_PUCGR|nr:Inorganic pyrophosphatase [Puccinia graminis f. sp. tritici]
MSQTQAIRRLTQHKHFLSPLTRSLSSSSTSQSNPNMSSQNNNTTTRLIGAPNTLEHRVYLENNGAVISAFHDLPLFANEQHNVFNMIVEVPRWTNAKMEISKSEPFNPILQDVKKNKLRFVRNCFPHHGYIWNYGAFPQTWEDPAHTHPETKAKGDNDPLDVCEIGEAVGYVGQVKQVKVLGVMALLDEGETDWKIMQVVVTLKFPRAVIRCSHLPHIYLHVCSVVDVNDPLAPKLNDIEDVERHLPGLIRATNEWFRIYKIPDGKPENQFAFSGEAKHKNFATDVILECHEAWKRLMKDGYSGISLANTTVEGSQHRVGHADVPSDSRQDPAPIDPSISKWFLYVSV